jgi:hypothetical protein
MGAFVQRYERLLADPERSLRELADHLGLPWSAEAAWGAARAAGLDVQREVAASLLVGGADGRSLVHWDHVANPDGGAWRGAWTGQEVALARARLGPLMERFGYPWD